MSNSKPCFALFFDWKKGWIPLEGKERKSFRTKLHWILNKCVSSGTSVQGGGSLTWIGRGWYRVGATKGYEGEGLEGRVEWLLGGSSTECRDNKLSSAGFNHLPLLIKPNHITVLPLFYIIVVHKLYKFSAQRPWNIFHLTDQIRCRLPLYICGWEREKYSLISGVFSVGGRLSRMVIRKTVIERRAEIPRVTCKPWWWKQMKSKTALIVLMTMIEVQKTIPRRLISLVTKPKLNVGCNSLTNWKGANNDAQSPAQHV